MNSGVFCCRSGSAEEGACIKRHVGFGRTHEQMALASCDFGVSGVSHLQFKAQESTSPLMILINFGKLYVGKAS